MVLNLQEVINSVNKILSVKEDNKREEKIIIDAINEGYNLLCYSDKRVTRAYTPIINGVLTLPSNCIKIIKSTPTIDASDVVVGNSIITDKEGIVDLLYTYIREPLTEPEDEFDLNTKLQYSLINYACYRLCESRGDNLSTEFLNQFFNVKSEFENKDTTGDCFTETVQLVE